MWVGEKEEGKKGVREGEQIEKTQQEMSHSGIAKDSIAPQLCHSPLLRELNVVCPSVSKQTVLALQPGSRRLRL